MSRIAFYAPLKPPDHLVASGDRMMARNLMAALCLAGHEVSVASRFRSYDAGDAARQDRLREIGQRLAERLVRRFDAHGSSAAPRPDLWFTYHLYHKAPDWLGPRVADQLGIPYVVAEASYAPKQAAGRWALGHRGVAGAIARADRIFQPNPADAECVTPLLASPDRLVPLPPFLDSAPFRALSRHRARSAIAAAYDLDPATPWLLTVAMMRDDQKLRSYRCLASALALIPERRWQLIIAGVGPAEASVREAFAPLAARIRWVGVLDRDTLLRTYRTADLYVWPAIKEAWGMAFLEAQAAGAPVVAGRSGGVPGIVADGETGLLTPEGDAAAFAAAVGALLADPARRVAMGSAAEVRVARHHDISVAAALLDRHIRALTVPAP